MSTMSKILDKIRSIVTEVDKVLVGTLSSLMVLLGYSLVLAVVIGVPTFVIVAVAKLAWRTF